MLDTTHMSSIFLSRLETQVTVNNVIQSRTNRNGSSGDYWTLISLLCLAFETPNVLMIGLGGGSIISEIKKLNDNIPIEVAEIDKEIIEIYKNYFPVYNDVIIHNEDGIDFLKQKKSCYNLLILDAYDSDKIPNIFLTDLFIENAYVSLIKNGIFAINCINDMKFNGELAKLIEKLKMRFSVNILANSSVTNNIILVCSEKEVIDAYFSKILMLLKNNNFDKNIVETYLNFSKA